MWGGVKDSPVIDWGDVEARLRESIVYWLVVGATARPVWGIWHDERLLLSVGSTMLWRGLGTPADGAPTSAHLEDGHDVVIVEGVAASMTDPDERTRFCEVYNPKYNWDFTPETAGGVVTLHPSVVLAWQSAPYDESKTSPFPLAASRFTFD